MGAHAPEGALAAQGAARHADSPAEGEHVHMKLKRPAFRDVRPQHAMRLQGGCFLADEAPSRWFDRY